MPKDNRPSRAYRPIPMDFELLERLPDKGMIGGLHWKGRRARDLRAEILEASNGLNPDLLTTDMVQARLRSMSVGSLVENFPAAGSNAVIWARTIKGKELLERREEVLGG